MDSLKVSLIQTEIIWENSQANLDALSKKIELIEKTDLIVLAEMFNTGFSMNEKELAQNMDGEAVSWMKEIAKEKNSAICGSLIIVEDGKFFNRFIWIEANGKLLSYDKKHLFSMAEENKHFTSGQNVLTIDYKGWKIRPLICYDLRFPVWSRNKLEEETHSYDILLYVANWPKVRKDAWEKLLYARAIENQAYVIGVNGIGKDGNEMEYAGSSGIIDMKGDLLNNSFTDTELIIEKSLSYENLIEFRDRFPVLKDADNFEIKL